MSTPSTPNKVTRGRAAVEAYEAAKSRPGYPFAKSSSKQYELLRLMTLAPAALFHPVNGAEKRTTIAMRTVATILLAHWNEKENCAWPGHETLREISGLSPNALDQAIRGLREAGLFGISSGGKGHTSRYYPLFHEPSRMAFIAKLNRTPVPMVIEVDEVEDDDRKGDIPPF